MAEASPTVSLTAEIVSAYLANNSIGPNEVATLIQGVHQALSGLATAAQTEDGVVHQKPSPAQIRNSITPEHLISFEDGRPYKILRRHLARLGLTPEMYRAKWGLPPEYPMTAAGYARRRSELAKAAGLGRKR